MTLGASLTAHEVSQFHQAALAAYEHAVLRQGRQVLGTSVAGVNIDVETAGSALMGAFQPALAGIATSREGAAAARILIFDTQSSGVAAPQFERPIQHLIRSRGDCWTEADARCRVVFHMSDYTLQVFDPDTATCVVVVADAAKLPKWTLAAPLRSPLAMILETHGVHLVHGAAVGYADGAALITGYGGSGKSTTTLSCHKAGMPILGDDYVAICPPRGEDTWPTVHHIFSSLKLVPQEVGGACSANGVEDKRIVFPFPQAPERWLRSAPLRAVLSAQVEEVQCTEVECAAAEDVARVAFASTALQIPMANEGHAAALILACVRLAGAHTLKLGSERASAAHSLAHLLRGQPDPRTSAPPVPAWQQTGALKPVSVVIPVHNGASFIGEAVASVAAQRYGAIELIIVDDGSTDDLDAALSRIQTPFQCIRQPQRGPAAARNAGLRAAKNEWIAFLDVDDLWPKGSLMKRAQDLALHSRAAVVHGQSITFRTDPQSGAFVPAYHPRETYPFYIGAGLYRRSVFDTVGMFDETLQFAEDTDWYWRAAEVGTRVIDIPEHVLSLRMHSSNMTADKVRAEHGAVQAFKRMIHRKRQATLGERRSHETTGV